MAKKHNKSTGRQYRKEYLRFQGKPAQIKRRAIRNKARRKAVKRHGKAALRGKDVNHTSTSLRGRTTIESKSRNRGFRRSKTGKNLGLPRKKG